MAGHPVSGCLAQPGVMPRHPRKHIPGNTACQAGALLKEARPMSTLNHQPLTALVTGANAGLGKDTARRRQPHEGQRGCWSARSGSPRITPGPRCRNTGLPCLAGRALPRRWATARPPACCGDRPTPPSPATTSQLPVDVSARPSRPTSIVNHRPGSAGPPDHTFSAVKPDTYRPQPDTERESEGNMQAAQLTVWKSPPKMRDVHDLRPRAHGRGAARRRAGAVQRVGQPHSHTDPGEGRRLAIDRARFMPVLQRAELVESTRIGQWTYHRCNEGSIAAPPELPGTSL